MNRWMISHKLIKAHSAYRSVAPGALISIAPGPAKIAVGAIGVAIPTVKVLLSKNKSFESGVAFANIAIGLGVHTIQYGVSNKLEPVFEERLFEMISRKLIEAQHAASVIQSGFEKTSGIGILDIVVIARTVIGIFKASNPAVAIGEAVAWNVIGLVINKIKK